jgi:hypothetical protein
MMARNSPEVLNLLLIDFKGGAAFLDLNQDPHVYLQRRWSAVVLPGNITSGGKAEHGSYVTITLVDGGRGVLLSVANGDNGFPFCKIVNGGKVNSADCGA